jgi:hypothetical protein
VAHIKVAKHDLLIAGSILYRQFNRQEWDLARIAGLTCFRTQLVTSPSKMIRWAMRMFAVTITWGQYTRVANPVVPADTAGEPEGEALV